MLDFFVKLQTLLPHYLLSKIVFRLASSDNKLIKNLFIRSFIKAFKVDLLQAQIKNPEQYSNFNQFFTRKLDQDARPICNTSKIISPVDGKVLTYGVIHNNTLLQAKGKDYTVSSLLGSNDSQFTNGSHYTIYLSPQDYHRVHMPCDGRLTHMRYIPGRLFSVNPISCASINNIFARNERVISLFETKTGTVAIILVGAMLVGSIATAWHGVITPPHGRKNIINHNYSEDDISFNKGDELGYFQMGSTVIMLFEHKQNFKSEMEAKKVILGQGLID